MELCAQRTEQSMFSVFRASPPSGQLDEHSARGRRGKGSRVGHGLPYKDWTRRCAAREPDSVQEVCYKGVIFK